jgi:hypothetical protein
MKAIKE